MFFIQSIKVPREEWYWPKAEADEDEEEKEEEEEDALEEEEEIVELTVSIFYA